MHLTCPVCYHAMNVDRSMSGEMLVWCDSSHVDPLPLKEFAEQQYRVLQSTTPSVA
jgi:hypothetical protein